MNKNLRRSTELVELITRGSIPRAILKISVPLIIANTFVVILELVDAFFVGRLGSDMFAAVTMGSIVMFFLATFGMGLGIGTIAMVSRSSGEKDFENVSRITLQALYAGFLISVILTVVGIIFTRPLLILLGAESSILEAAASYLRILFIGSFTMFFMFLGNAVFQGAGDTVTPMKISALATLLNIALDPVMIFGLLGFPAMGVSGAALATVISRTAGGIVILYILFFREHTVRIDRSSLGIDFPLIRRIVTIGLPGSIQMLMRSFSMVVLIRIVSGFGNTMVAVYGLGGRLFHFFLFPGFGLGGAASTMVGQNLGAGNPERAVKSTVIAFYCYLVFLAVTASLLFAFPGKVASLFNPETAFVEISEVFFRYVSAGVIFLSASIIFSRALQGAGDTMSPMIATGISLYIIQIPLAYYLSNRTVLAETGIWLSLVAGGMINAVLVVLIFFRGRWKNREL